MGQVSIPVDLLNPGQVFACLGLLEAADVLCGPAEGGFDWSGESRFNFGAEVKNPLAEVLDFLAAAKIAAIAPATSALTDEYGLPTIQESEPVSPSPELKASVLPVVLCDQADRKIRLSHWSESNDSAGGFLRRTIDRLSLGALALGFACRFGLGLFAPIEYTIGAGLTQV